MSLYFSAVQSQTPQKPSVPPLLSVSFTITASPPVESRLCGGPVPNRSQACHLPCPIECQVSPWGAWGPCTFENCEDQSAKKGFKLRRRVILTQPGGGADCPHLVEAVPCEEPLCWSWRVLSLEQCVPDGELPCGVGSQTSLLQCVNSTGSEVDRGLCSSSPPPAPERCEVPCPRDCVLSDWTPWTSCSQTCSSKTIEGKQMRTRSILAYNAGEVTAMVVAWITVIEGLSQVPKFPELFGGALCPNSSALQEVRNCNEHACTVYHWQTGAWGACTEDTSSSSNSTIARGSCASGVQTRKVICVRVNVGQVPPKK
ncbi:unnamed protein product [Knipowitschia caucasica]